MKTFSSIHRKNLSMTKIGLLGEKCNAWKGGVHIGNGYRILNTRGKKTREHRMIMEKHLSRKLRSDEVVHHKDENKLNNKIKNLEVMSITEHRKHHMSKHRIPAKLVKHYNRNK